MADTDTDNAEYVNQWRLWVYRYELERLQGHSHVLDRLTTAVVRKLEADLLDPSHRGSAAVTAGDELYRVALEVAGRRAEP